MVESVNGDKTDHDIPEQNDKTSLSKSVSRVSLNSTAELLQGTPAPSMADAERPNSQGFLQRKLRRLWEFSRSRRFQQEILRTSMAIIVFGTITSLMMMAQMTSDEWFDRYSKSQTITQAQRAMSGGFKDVFATDPLHDRLFELIPDWQHLRGSLPDLLLSAYLVSFFVFNVFWVHRKRIQYQGLVVLRRFLWIMSCLYLFRTMTFLVTTVPNPIHNCVPKYAEVTDFEAYVRLIKDMASGRVSACTDNIYSGHTTLTVVILFSFWMYSGSLALQLYAVLHAVAIVVAILITRLHYTIDVLIAMFMGAFIFLTFHFLLTVMLDDRLMESVQLDEQNEEIRVLCNERVTLHRVYKRHINRAVWWMDGFDLRLAHQDNADGEADVVEEMQEADSQEDTKGDKIISPTVHKV